MSPVLAAADPRLTASYGGWAIDQTHGCILSSEYDKVEDHLGGVFYIEFHVRMLEPGGGTLAQDDTTFAALVAAVESNLRIPRGRLLVKLGASTVCDWDSGAPETAFQIVPELTLLEMNARDYRYGLRVRCQFPGNVPSANRRRESVTRYEGSIRERRTVTITGTWTSDGSFSAYDRYLSSGDAFFAGQLPLNVAGGAWVQADADASFDDENSVVTATRTYWEILSGRRESATQTVTGIAGRRVCTISGVWVATSGFTALQNFTDNGGAFFTAKLPTPVANGAWVQVDEDPTYNDQNAVLTVTRTYQEVVNGLREVSVRVTTGANGLRTVELKGVYYASGGTTAKQNYDANIAAQVTAAIGSVSPALTRYESHSIPKIEGYDTTGLRYFFEWTLNELAYPQSTVDDDSKVTVSFLDIAVRKPKDPQSSGATYAVTRLMTVRARFVATIDYQEDQDPVALWESALRDHVLGAVIAKLGADVTAVQVVDEDVGAGLHSNQLVGSLDLIVTGGSVLSIKVIQVVTKFPGRDFVPLADGTNFSYKPYRAPPEELLFRRVEIEYVSGDAPTDDIFEDTFAGFGMIDTGKTAEESISDQNASSELSQNDWFIDRRSSEPFSEEHIPLERGDDFQTVLYTRTENWRRVDSVSAGEVGP